MKSFELYKLIKNGITYRINGNMHTLKQIKIRAITRAKLEKMVMLSIEKMEIQKTYAVIDGNDKLLILRINTKVYFIITCLGNNMQVKGNTIRLYLRGIL